MHQIYSCSDENLEVFTTVISSKCEYMLKQNNRQCSGKLEKHVSARIYIPHQEKKCSQWSLRCFPCCHCIPVQVGH
uniref:Uncharacterized protein n=1 Tax=Terrapene triunguis TaxID=2587831 RepID=A0A674K824_9SAUR